MKYINAYNLQDYAFLNTDALIGAVKNIPYFLIYGEKDEIITANFMPKFLEKMKTMGMDVTYRIQKNMTHCDMEHHREAMEAWCGFLIEHAG